MIIHDTITCKKCGALNEYEPDVAIGQEVLLRCACGEVVKTRYFYSTSRTNHTGVEADQYNGQAHPK